MWSYLKDIWLDKWYYLHQAIRLPWKLLRNYYPALVFYVTLKVLFSAWSQLLDIRAGACHRQSWIEPKSYEHVVILNRMVEACLRLPDDGLVFLGSCVVITSGVIAWASWRFNTANHPPKFGKGPTY